MSAKTTLVIGGGFSGIACATALRDAGIRVTLVDDRAVLGGRARSDVLDEWNIDVGAQLVAESYSRTVAMLRAAGGDSALRAVPGRDLFVRDGARYPISFGSVRSLLSFGAVSARDKIRLATHLVPLLATNRAALNADGERIPGSLDEMSAGEFIRERISSDAESALVEPVCNTFCTASGDEVSLAFYLALGRYGSEGNVLAPANGWTAALDAAVSDVNVLRNSRVNLLTRTARGLRATLEDRTQIDCDAAVIATSAGGALHLLDGLGGAELMDWLSGVETRSTFTLAALVKASLPHEVFGIMQHNDGETLLSALAVHGTKAPDQSTDAGEVVLAWPTPNSAIRLAGAPAQSIAEACVPEIERLLPATRGSIAHVRVYRHEPGNSLPRPGFAAHRTTGRTLASRIDAPIALAGDYLTMPLIEGAVASGQQAAAQIRDKLGV